MSQAPSLAEVLKDHVDTLVSLELTEQIEDCFRCQSNHRPNSWGLNDSGCTVKATHTILSTCDGDDILICESRALWNLQVMAGIGVCDRCDRPCSECWIITKIA